MILVVGADGTVGRALVSHFERAGVSTLATTRRRETVSAGRLFLDLSQHAGAWRAPEQIRVAVICSGVTRMRACREHPAESAAINVAATTALGMNLVEAGTFVIYLSSNQVFDGTVTWPAADAPYSPVTEYGRQKAETERRLALAGERVAIVRFSKILEPAPVLFRNWVDAGRRGETVRPFSDVFLAPVPLVFAVALIRLIADRGLGGIFQASAERDLTYEQAARLGFAHLGIDSALIVGKRSCDGSDFQDFTHYPTAMESERVRMELGICPPPAEWTIARAFESAAAENCLPQQPCGGRNAASSITA